MHRLHAEASLAGGVDEGGDLYIGKALLDALCLTHRNLAVPQTFVKHQSNNDVHGYVVSDIRFADSHYRLLCISRRLYTYRRGLRRCSFRQTGDARASESGTSDREIPTLLLCIAINS